MLSLLLNAFFPQFGAVRDKLLVKLVLLITATCLPLIGLMIVSAISADFIGKYIPPEGVGNLVDSIIFIAILGISFFYLMKWLSRNSRLRNLVKINMWLAPLLMAALFFFDSETPNDSRFLYSISAFAFTGLLFIVIGYIFIRYQDDPDANTSTLWYPVAKKMIAKEKYTSGFAIIEGYAKRHNHRLSLIDLGDAHASGLGKPKDNVKAAIYYFRASHSEYSPAQDKLREHLKELSAEEIDEVQTEKMLY